MAINWDKPLRYKEYAYGKALPVEYAGRSNRGYRCIKASESWVIEYYENGTPVEGCYRAIENYEPEPEVKPVTVDWTKPVQHLDGTPLRVLCTDAPGVYPVVTLTQDGGVIKYPLVTTRATNVPEKRTVYINVHKGTTVDTFETGPYPSRPTADAMAEHRLADRIACVKVEYTVGQFDT